MKYLENFDYNNSKKRVVDLVINKVEEEGFLPLNQFIDMFKQKKEYLDEVISFYNANMNNIEIVSLDTNTRFIKSTFNNYVKYPLRYEDLKDNLYYLHIIPGGDIHDDLDEIIKFKTFVKKRFQIIREANNFLFFYLEPLEDIRFYNVHENVIIIKSINYFKKESAESLEWASKIIREINKEIFSIFGSDYKKLGLEYSYDMNSISVRFLKRK